MKAGHNNYHVILCESLPRGGYATQNAKKVNQPAPSLHSHLTCKLNNPVIYDPTKLLTSHIRQLINSLVTELEGWTLFKPVFLKLSSAAVRRSPQEVSEEKELQKLYQTLNEWKIQPYMSWLKLLCWLTFNRK
jgi:hypothetical protein